MSPTEGSPENTRPKAWALYQRLKREGEAAGYFLNPDVDFVLDLMDGLLTNEQRYGYRLVYDVVRFG